MSRSRIPSIVKLFLPQIICRIPFSPQEGLGTKGKKTVYLTFDDGPEPETTPLILDILKRYNIKATFFCVGENVNKHPEIYKHIIEEGHSAGNHTFNHLNGWKTPLKKYIENVNACRDAMRKFNIQHSTPNILFRPPYGKMTLGQYNALKKRFNLIFWDVLVPDFDVNSSAQECLAVVKRKTRAGSILIFHDNLKVKNKLTELLTGSLDFLIHNNYDIQPVTINILKLHGQI